MTNDFVQRLLRQLAHHDHPPFPLVLATIPLHLHCIVVHFILQQFSLLNKALKLRKCVTMHYMPCNITNLKKNYALLHTYTYHHHISYCYADVKNDNDCCALLRFVNKYSIHVQ